MSDLWIPADAETLEQAITSGTVIETHFQEYKQFASADSGSPRVPPTLAKTLAGLAIDGGVLILGVAEDKAGQRFAARPQRLLGLRDAVDQVALTAVSPALRVTVRELERNDGTGYLVVIVPSSPRSPHMVGGRYYGRGESTSRQLADAEVRALWLRHLERRDVIGSLLKDEVKREPVPEQYRTNSRLFVVAQPISADPTLLLSAVPDRDLLTWVQGLTNTALYRTQRPYAPTFASQGSSQRRAHGVARTTSYLYSDRTLIVEDNTPPMHSSILDLEFHEDGGLRLYYGRASDLTRDGRSYLLIPGLAGEVAGLIEAARLIADETGFRGSWSFGVALRGIRGIAAYDQQRLFSDGWRFSEDGYDETTEVDFATLHDPGSPVLDALIGRLIRSTMGTSTRVADLDLFAIAPNGT